MTSAQTDALCNYVQTVTRFVDAAVAREDLVEALEALDDANGRLASAFTRPPLTLVPEPQSLDAWRAQ